MTTISPDHESVRLYFRKTTRAVRIRVLEKTAVEKQGGGTMQSNDCPHTRVLLIRSPHGNFTRCKG
jgi:hypothetical protein